VNSCITVFGALTDGPAAILLLNRHITSSTESRTGFLGRNLKQGDHLKDLKFDGILNVKGNRFPVHAMKTYNGVEVDIPSFLTSALEGGEWSASRSGRLTYEQQLTTPAAYEVVWAPGSVWTSWKRQRPFPLSGLKPRFVQTAF